MQTLANPNMLDIYSPGGIYHGGSQMWYPIFWWRLAGCGPVSASNIMWYLSRSHSGLKKLWDADDASKRSFMSLMKRMYHYVTPGMRGVNRTEMLTDGVLRYAESRGEKLNANVLEIPEDTALRPTADEVSRFITSALKNDLPIAFLNLSNGNVKNLDNWHWVTIIGFDEKSMTAQISDQGKKLNIDLALWLNATTIGGGFVFFSESENQ